MDELANRHLTFAVIGLGYWGPNLLRVLVEDVDVTVRWICDTDEERLVRLARRYPGIRTTCDLDDVLFDEEVDAVLIATPVFTHVDLCTRSLLAGKHTFVEKPLATSAALADELVRLADTRDRVLMCGHTFVYSPAVNAVRGMLEEGVVGNVYFVSASRVNLGLHQRDVSVVWDLGPHDFSILLHWLGERPDTVRATGRDSIVRGVVDVAFVTLRFPSGVVAQVELSWLSPSKLRRTVVVGSEKMVVYEDGAPEPLRLFDHGVVYSDPETFGQYQLSYRTGDIVAPKLEAHEPLKLELADFGNAIRSGDPMLYNTALARDVVAITEAASRSLEAGGAEVRVERSTALYTLPPLAA
ncbi:MAG TPA: Gfo/Idh/MocA family oxidoreductase [Solirubrobacteraceae bacterium]